MRTPPRTRIPGTYTYIDASRGTAATVNSRTYIARCRDLSGGGWRTTRRSLSRISRGSETNSIPRIPKQIILRGGIPRGRVWRRRPAFGSRNAEDLSRAARQIVFPNGRIFPRRREGWPEVRLFTGDARPPCNNRVRAITCVRRNSRAVQHFYVPGINLYAENVQKWGILPLRAPCNFDRISEKPYF